MKSGIEEAVATICNNAAKDIEKIADDPYIREGVAQMATREFCWAIADSFDNHLVLAEHLRILARVIENQYSK